MNIGERIRELRIKKGLSQEDLAIRSDFSKSYIQKFEEGHREIRSSQLVQLSGALGVSIPEILNGTSYSSDEFTLRNIEFREGFKINFDRTFFERKILGELHGKYNSYISLEKLVNSIIVFQNPLKNFDPITNKKQVEDAAKILRKKWKFETTPIYNLVSFLEDLGVKIFEVSEDESFAGFSCWEKNNPIIVINVKNSDIPRRRFTIFHELAHLLLRFEVNEEMEKIERFCDHFAGAMLLPYEALMSYIGDKSSITLEELKRIKTMYGISIFAILIRILSLGLIGWEKYQEWKDQYDSWKDKDIPHEDTERVSRFNYLLAKGLNEKLFSKSKASQLSGMTITALSRESFTTEFTLR
ncbi:helix-turn-helix domain-containing protein [Chryseobacterium scophthalmum]|uniref:Zn-dependent peptidase ImmA, M78 family n=1 Tax=Chryseobacterium scophthalmum TaxID=59733 RepID=A0A1N6HHF3_9FLAO|nr:XRE family transcriptional regulator [Chryseobacterium scophthalmum]SIO19119.1 Zn-dependent peptidase ImmA, M78 family [Chryseobacterium scophthalmum]